MSRQSPGPSQYQTRLKLFQTSEMGDTVQNHRALCWLGHRFGRFGTKTCIGLTSCLTSASALMMFTSHPSRAPPSAQSIIADVASRSFV
jgi:hypothetical protein